MTDFETRLLPADRDVVAPDGSEVRIVGAERRRHGSFSLGPGQTSKAVTHRTIEEIWFFVSGRGEMWRKQGARETTEDVEAGTCVTIPLGTRFQFRSVGSEPLAAVAVTMPPWPGEDDAVVIEGIWEPTRSDSMTLRTPLENEPNAANGRGCVETPRSTAW